MRTRSIADAAGAVVLTAMILVLCAALPAGAQIPQQKLTASDAAANDYFGNTVAVDGELVVVGAPYKDDPETDSGAAYVFYLDGPASVEHWALYE